MDKFEKLIKDAVKGYEAPYSADAWQALNKKLGPTKGGALKWIAASAAIVTLIIVGYNLIPNSTSVINNQKNNNNKTNSNINLKTNNVLLTDVLADENINQTKNEIKNNTSNSVTNTDLASNVNIPEHTDNNQTNNSINLTTINIDEVENINEIDYIIEDIVENDKNLITNSKPDYNATILIDNTTKCKSEYFTFKPEIPKQKAIYEWDLGNGIIKIGGIISHKYDNAGIYTVTLTLKDKKTHKILKVSEGIDINVLSTPQSDFTFEHSNGVIPNTLFKANVKPQTNIQWEIVGVHSNNNAQFTYSFKHKGDYVVKLKTTANNGCATTATKVVSINKDYNLLAPTAFSPNDDYLNDVFIPKALPLLNLPFTMTIYDRQGKMVYQTTDANSPWDGLYKKDGVPAPNGVYIWVVQLTNEKGEIEQYQDQITIAR